MRMGGYGVMRARALTTTRPLGAVFAPAAAILMVAALGLAACGGPAKPKRGGGLSTADVFQRALVAKEAGKCDQAIPDFERLARIGRGWELAQVYLAQCLIEQGRNQGGSLAQASYAEALNWLEPAAQSNESEAQVLLASVYLDGLGRPRDVVEAGKWYMLSRKSAIEGINDGPKAIGQRLEATLSPAEWELARARAQTWTPDYQAVNAAALPRGGRRGPEEGQDAGRSGRRRPPGRLEEPPA